MALAENEKLLKLCKLLQLSDWDIIVEYLDSVNNGENLGIINYFNRTAHIKISNAEETNNGLKHIKEITLMHELLHLKFAWMSPILDKTGGVMLEDTIDDLSLTIYNLINQNNENKKEV